MNAARDILVYSAHGVSDDELLGVLSARLLRGKELFAFSYDEDWLKRHPMRTLDPDLRLYKGPQYTDKVNFGLFADSSPDRWGRRLMQRREALRARRMGEKPRVLTESDYLLGVYDATRMGALRFKSDVSGPFLNDDREIPTPPFARLRELETACRDIEAWSEQDDHEKWLSMLLAPGSSLGGARPKANVVDEKGNLWIAKFPSRNDEMDVGAWEFLTMTLACEVGIRTAPIRLEKFSSTGSTFLTRRFDRQGVRRIHFASAMTLLGKSDGADASSGASYLELVEFLSRYGSDPDGDLRELWKRIVFSIAVSNTDDHLRNHGFLLDEKGWRLSPAYDINPNAEGMGLSLNISDVDNALDFDLALEVAEFFRVTKVDAEKTLSQIRRTVSGWSSLATRLGISRASREAMAPAFRI